MRTVLTALLLFLLLQMHAWASSNTLVLSLHSTDTDQSDLEMIKAVSDSSQNLPQPKGGGVPLTLETKSGNDATVRNSSSVVSKAEKSLADYFIIQPTPNLDKIYISGNDHYFSRIEVVNAAGNILVFTNDKDSDILLGLPKLTKGTYEVRIYTEHGLIVKNFVKK